MIDGVIDGVIGFKDWNVFHNIIDLADLDYEKEEL